MNTPKTNVMNYVIDDQKYYICNVCGYRMKKKESDARVHLKNVHAIGPEDVIENQVSGPFKLRTMGFHMKEWLKTQFIQIEDQNEWKCTLCTTILVGSEPWMNEYNHLRTKHRQILIPAADDRCMPGCSSWTADTIPSTLSRNESPTAETSTNIHAPFHIEHEEMNESIYRFEHHMSVDDREENFFQDEDTIDLGNKYHKESRTSIANGSEKLNVNVKREITDDGHPTEPVSFVSRNGTSNQHRSGSSNTQGYHNSRTTDEQKIKCEDSEHDESDDEIEIVELETDDSERINDIGTSANPSRASSKRLSVTSTSHKTPTKKVKLESSSTDPVDENSSRDANQPLPDSNTTSSSESLETQLLLTTDQIIRSMSTEAKRRIIQAILGQLYEKRE